MSFDMAGNDKIMRAWISKQNLTDVAKQLKHNGPPAYNIPSVSPVIYCSALSYLRLASDHVGICRQLIGYNILTLLN